MIGVGQTLPNFKVTGVKPGFMRHEEGGQSAFETITADAPLCANTCRWSSTVWVA